jgi:hypothetical protein
VTETGADKTRSACATGGVPWVTRAKRWTTAAYAFIPSNMCVILGRLLREPHLRFRSVQRFVFGSETTLDRAWHTCAQCPFARELTQAHAREQA